MREMGGDVSKFDEKAGELLNNAALAAGAFEMFDQTGGIYA
jgi:hypothetical protein